MPLYLFYTMMQKSQKWPKTQIKGGSCLNFWKANRGLKIVEIDATCLGKDCKETWK